MEGKARRTGNLQLRVFLVRVAEEAQRIQIMSIVYGRFLDTFSLPQLLAILAKTIFFADYSLFLRCNKFHYQQLHRSRSRLTLLAENLSQLGQSAAVILPTRSPHGSVIWRHHHDRLLGPELINHQRS